MYANIHIHMHYDFGWHYVNTKLEYAHTKISYLQVKHIFKDLNVQ